MTGASIRIVLVDTNCFLRLYHSPVLPLMGQDIGGFRLLTLESLVDEFHNNPVLTQSYPSVSSGPKHDDLTKAKLKIRSATKTSVKIAQTHLRPYAKSLLESYCNKRKINIHSLSNRDLDLLATTIELKGIMATDEWPLRIVAQDLMEDPDEYEIGIYHSLELLQLLENYGKLSPENRRKTVRSWVLYRENLLKGWELEYQRLFGESVASLDGV